MPSNEQMRHGESGGFYGGAEMHTESWRVHGNEAQMVDVSENGPLSPAVDSRAGQAGEAGEAKGEKRWPDAPGFPGDGDADQDASRFTGALDGAAQAGDPREYMQRGKSWPTELNGGTRKPDLVGY